MGYGRVKMLATIVTVGIEIFKAAMIIGLVRVYVKNYRDIKSKFGLGLLIFATLLLLETIVSISIFSTTSLCQSIQIAEIVRPILGTIECIGIAVLTWITWKS